MNDCIFCRMVIGDLPARKVFEDDDVLSFHDISPHAPIHILIIPKTHIGALSDCTELHERILGKMLLLAPQLASEQGATDGFRTIINTGRVGGQEVYHLHMHVLGGPETLGRMVSGR